jgi:hypothetical protein
LVTGAWHRLLYIGGDISIRNSRESHPPALRSHPARAAGSITRASWS